MDYCYYVLQRNVECGGQGDIWDHDEFEDASGDEGFDEGVGGEAFELRCVAQGNADCVAGLESFG